MHGLLNKPAALDMYCWSALSDTHQLETFGSLLTLRKGRELLEAMRRETAERHVHIVGAQCRVNVPIMTTHVVFFQGGRAPFPKTSMS